MFEKEGTGITLKDTSGNLEKITEVKDSFDKTHRIKKILGQGGQGVVCRTADSEIVVKFVLNPIGQLISLKKDKESFKTNDAKFRDVACKPFPDRLHLAYPMARLQDYSGYVMRLMGDMTSFADLVPSDTEQIKKMTEDGGHRRRFDLLSKLAAVIAKLHGNGMVYCDISGNNVFVTKDPKFQTQNVWLIDADNIFIPGEDPCKNVYTPAYAAPELLEGTPCSASSDIYSFATLAFESLAALHPFAGAKAVNWNGEGDDDDWDATTDKNEDTDQFDTDPRYSGKYPWVEDPEDTSNHTSAGLPRNTFLTDETFFLFNMTFSEEGRKNPLSRPTAALWSRAFAHSHALSVRCTSPDCGMSFVYDETLKCCPWCGQKLPKLLALKDKSGKIVFVHELNRLDKDFGESFVIPEHIFAPFNINTFFHGVLTARPVNLNGFGIKFEAADTSSGRNFFININGNEEKIRSSYILQPQKGCNPALKYKDTADNTVSGLTITIIEEK